MRIPVVVQRGGEVCATTPPLWGERGRDHSAVTLAAWNIHITGSCCDMAKPWQSGCQSAELCDEDARLAIVLIRFNKVN